MDPIPFVRAAAFLPFLTFLERLGAPVERGLSDVLLPPHALQEPESLIPLNQALLFIERSARAEGLTNFGILAAQHSGIGQLGMLGRLLRHSLTLHDALVKGIGLLRMYNSSQLVWLDNWNGRARLCHGLAPNAGVGRCYSDQYTFMMLIDLVRIVAGPYWLPDKIHIGQGTENRSVLDFLGVQTSVQEVSAIVFDPALLGRVFPNDAGANSMQAVSAMGCI